VLYKKQPFAMNFTDYRKSWLTIAAVTIMLAFAFQGSRGLWEPDEGGYVRHAYEMLQSGYWLMPS
jgi:4-amino-4-deoxy-L-arabinose transferase-like glycosyltransferase